LLYLSVFSTFYKYLGLLVLIFFLQVDVLHASEMAEYQQQNRPQYFENAANSQQQPDYLYSTGENSRPNNPRRNEYIRDDFR